MTEDKALERGIRRRLTDSNGLIIGSAWYRAWERREVVGTCRALGCDGLMTALPNHDDGPRIVWYTASCLSCGTEVALRGDKPVLERSSRRHEMPAGSFDRREKYLKMVYDAAKARAEAAA